MRRFDKDKTIQKANILAEQRYLHSKGLLKENFDDHVSYEFTYNGIVNDNTIVYDTIQKIKKEYNGLSIGFGHDGELIISFPSALSDDELEEIKLNHNATLFRVIGDLN